MTPENTPASGADAATAAEAPATRRSLSAGRRRTARRRLSLIGGVAAVALVTGTGFAVTSMSAAGADTISAEQHAADVKQQKADIATSLAQAKARSTIQIANQVVASTSSRTDASDLQTQVASLADYEKLDASTLNDRVEKTALSAQTVQSAAAEADRQAAAAAAAAQAAAEAQAAADAAAAAEAARAAADNSVDGAKATAQSLASSQYGWGSDQFSCLVSLWTKESGWNYKAYNPSGATGIPQALPGSKMASAGSDWATSAKTQITWGLGYIKSVYGTPCGAWSHSQSVNWY